MSEWQPIETAPETGIFLVTDGEVFGAATRFDFTEPAEIGFDSPKVYGFGVNTCRPNPKAGQLTRYWNALAGWSVWKEGAEWEDGEYESRSPKLLQPTHWRPLLEPPTSP